MHASYYPRPAASTTVKASQDVKDAVEEVLEGLGSVDEAGALDACDLAAGLLHRDDSPNQLDEHPSRASTSRRDAQVAVAIELIEHREHTLAPRGQDATEYPPAKDRVGNYPN